MFVQDYYAELVNGTVEPVDYSTSDIKQFADIFVQSN